MGKVGVKKMVPQHCSRILQVLHAVSANGLHNVGTHATQRGVVIFTKWFFHLRVSFFKVQKWGLALQ